MRLSRQDVSLAIRSFVRHPGFTITAVLSLALAIALNTTMYSVLDAMVNPRLEIRDPGTLYRITTWGDFKHKVDDATRASLLRAGFRTYEAVTYYQWSRSGGGVEFGNRYTQISSADVAPDFFQILGVRPKRGRLFIPSDLTAESQPVLISERLAATLSPDRDFPIGEKIDLDGVGRPVIGILRRGSTFPGSNQDLWMLPPVTVPLSSLPGNIVRLRPDVPVDQAVTELAVLSTRLAQLAGEDPKYTRYELSHAVAQQFHIVNFHYAIIGAVVAVLLIACANLANLQLARGIGRSREFALRAALGASRRDIVTQLLLESALLATAGLVVGLVLTFWGMHLLESRIPPSVADYVIAPQISWRLLAFAAAAGVVCTILIGLYPAIRVSRVDPNDLLKSGAGTGATKKNRQQYGVMVATEIGLALALLSGAAIVVRTALRVKRVNVGFDPKLLSTAGIFLRGRDTVLRMPAYSNEIVARMRAAPNVANAATYQYRNVVNNAITIDAANGPPRQLDAPQFGYEVVSPAYFRTFALPIIKGRDFVEGLVSQSEVIVDRQTASRLWPGADPIGRQIKLGEYQSSAPWIRVVGVVGSPEDQRDAIRSSDVEKKKASRLGSIYVLPASSDSSVLDFTHGVMMNLVVRATAEPARMPITIRRYLPKSGLIWWLRTSTMEENMSIARQGHNFVASMFALFATMAVGLAALGIYGIVAHSVVERKRELGVRLALGATARNIIYVVIRDGNPMALAGVAVGLLLIKKTVFWLHYFSVEGDEYDVVLFATMGAVLFAVAVLSALLPALRATRIDPVESLRCE